MADPPKIRFSTSDLPTLIDRLNANFGKLYDFLTGQQSAIAALQTAPAPASAAVAPVAPITENVTVVASGGGGTPSSLSYLTALAEPALGQSRRLAAGAGIAFTDSGPAAAFTVTAPGITAARFSQWSPVTVTNTIAETTLLGSGLGNLTLPANYFKQGFILELQGWGYWTATGNPTFRTRVYLGSTLLLDSAATTVANNAVASVFQVRALLTCTATGVSGGFIGQGTTLYSTSRTTVSTDDFTPLVAPVTIDTTVAQTLNVTFTWGIANASSLTLTNFVLSTITA